MSPQLSDLIAEGTPQRLAAGFQFTEGPVWHPDGYLLFSDIPPGIIYRWTPGGVTAYLTPSRHSNGLIFDRQGRLAACEHGGRQVSRMAGDGQMVPLAASYQGKRLNSPNDIVEHSSGRTYFTDPKFGIQPEQAELEFRGIYRLDPDGRISLEVEDFDGPNGLAFSPDESVLYINDSFRKHIRAFDVGRDGSLSNGRVFIDMNVDAPGVPDGMKVDVQGNVYCTGGGGVWVIDAGGRHLGTVAFPETPANLAFGGADNQTIYLTARTAIYSIGTRIPGIRTF